MIVRPLRQGTRMARPRAGSELAWGGLSIDRATIDPSSFLVSPSKLRGRLVQLETKVLSVMLASSLQSRIRYLLLRFTCGTLCPGLARKSGLSSETAVLSQC
jgi:hypothetical protein